MTIGQIIKWVAGTAAILSSLFLLLLVGRLETLFEILRALALGWASRATGLPAILWQGKGDILTSLGCTAAAVAGMHYLCRGIALHRGKEWRWKWSACLLGAALLCFGAAIAVTGVVHQAAWLRKEQFTDVDSPFFEAMRHQRISGSFNTYIHTHARLPQEVGELAAYGMEPGDFYVRGGVPWGYVQGHTPDTARRQLLLFDPRPDDEHSNTGFFLGDPDAWCSAEELPAAIEKSKRAAFPGKPKQQEGKRLK